MRWLLHLYPRPWRRRYGDEFRALLEAQPRSPRMLLDAALGALDAHLHPQVGSLSPFDLFTDCARDVLVLAQGEALGLRHNYVGTEHLLLALVARRDGVAARVLGSYGVNHERVQAAVRSSIGTGSDGDRGPPPRAFTRRAKKALELSVDEARRLDHHYIGTEHLLLGLMAEGEGVAGVLGRFGVRDLQQVSARLAEALDQP